MWPPGLERQPLVEQKPVQRVLQTYFGVQYATDSERKTHILELLHGTEVDELFAST